MSDKINPKEVFSTVTFTKFQSFALPNETLDDTLMRLLRLATTNTISDDLKERLIREGKTGDTLDDVIDNLLSYYKDQTLNYGIRKYVIARKEWEQKQQQREREKYSTK